MENNGTIYNRAKIWQIAGFALNNSATNCYMWFIGYISYFMTGSLGVGVVLATSFLTIMRIWDSVTDPFIGLTVPYGTTLAAPLSSTRRRAWRISLPPRRCPTASAKT